MDRGYSSSSMAKSQYWEPDYAINRGTVTSLGTVHMGTGDVEPGNL